jgi:hypothetical protein
LQEEWVPLRRSIGPSFKRSGYLFEEASVPLARGVGTFFEEASVPLARGVGTSSKKHRSLLQEEWVLRRRRSRLLAKGGVTTLKRIGTS